MTNRYIYYLSAVLVAANGSSFAEDNSEAPENWRCKFCEFEETQWIHEIELGLLYLSDSSFKYGRYIGLEDEGYDLITNYSGRFRDEDGYYVDIAAAELGLDSRSLSIAGGRQGRSSYLFHYNETPYLVSDSGQTPFNGVGDNGLALPGNWVGADETGDMSSLEQSLNSVDIHSKRKDLTFAYNHSLNSRIEYFLKFEHLRKDGIQSLGGSFGVDDGFSTVAAILPSPIDYVTNQLDIGLNYHYNKWNASVAYFGSFFTNEYDSLTWENPFEDPGSTKPGSVSTEGRLALAPDNTFHQLRVSATYQFSTRTRFFGSASVGRMLQDENFLPYSVNAGLATEALPVSSLDGTINTSDIRLGISASPTRKLSINARFKQNERDNQTDSNTYSYVITDTQTSLMPRTNLPYSFRKAELELSARYRLTRDISIQGGVDRRTEERTDQEVDKTTDDTGWAKAHFNVFGVVDAETKLSRSSRDIDDYLQVDEIVLPENPLLRKYNMADRDRDQADVQFNISPTGKIDIGVFGTYAKDDYEKSQIGLTENIYVATGLDISLFPTKFLDLHAFVTKESYESSQAGSQTFSEPDWHADSEDETTTTGITANFHIIEDVLDIGVSLTHTETVESMTLSSDTLTLSLQSLPDATTEFQSGNVFINYAISETMSLKLSYVYEKYEETDFAIADITASTLSDILLLGQEDDDYEVHLLAASVRYKF